MKQILDAFERARVHKGQPTVIIAHTVKGKGVDFMENVAGWHGKSPICEQMESALEQLKLDKILDKDQLFKKADDYQAEATKKLEAKMFYTSTNFVFDGNREEPYSEYSMPHPISEYGRTKLLGEHYVKDICERYFIARTSWLFGLNSKTFISQFLAAEKKPGSIDVICDQFASLTYIGHLAEAILRIIKSENYGTYHIVNRGVASWLDFVLRAKKIMRFRTTIRAIKTEELNLLAKRPRFSPLASYNYEFLFSCQMKTWEDALNDFIKILVRKS